MQIVFLMFFMFITDYLARIFYWYYSVSWFDMPMHFLGGLWLGLFFIYVLYQKTPFSTSIFKIILGVAIIGLSWELFQLIVKNGIGQTRFDALDTISDIFFDLAGGSFAIFLYFKEIMSIKENKIY